MNLINNIKFWFKNSRPYTIPITTLSFLVIFVYSLMYAGNIFIGILAYIAVSLLHLATNLSDDYFDYKKLIKEPEFCAKDCKCRYLRDGKASIDDLRNIIIILVLLAAICGGVIFFNNRFYVLFIALLALPIVIFYSKFSSKGFGDIAVILAYGPLMYEGVFYSMCGHFSFDVLILSFASASIVNSVLYTHMLMDFDEDIKVNKITLCTKFKTKEKALNFLLFFYVFSFILISFLIILSKNYWFLLTYLVIPLIIKLYKSLNLYNKNPISLPPIDICSYPLNLRKQLPINASFFHRFFMAINISTIFMVLCAAAVLIFKVV